MELDASYPQDLSKILIYIWDQYGELAWKNQEELEKYWPQQTENTTVVTLQTAEIGGAENAVMELRHIVQSLEIDLDSMKNLKGNLENSLREVEMHYAMQVRQLTRILLDLKSELAQTWTEWHLHVQEYKVLLNTKVKLEAEITTYHRLLEEGENFNLGDALDNSHSIQSIQKTTTHRTMDGKVMSVVSDTELLRHLGSKG